ncbi:MAG: N-acetyltransferase [Lentisphaeria bacterium]|nr:N-acetyltransferase [Lentisphaeria bacterium]
MKSPIIRPEKPEEFREMEELVRDAFWDRYSPGACEHLVVHKMRTSPAAYPPLCLAAETEGKLAGGIWYARAAVRGKDGESFPVLTLGPVAVRPGLQGQGIGSALIRRTLENLPADCRAVVLYGDPAYYGGFGFRPASEFGVTDSAGEVCPALQVFPAGEVPAGAFDEGAVYAVTPEEVRRFDRDFPHRQKHINSKQLFFLPPGPPPEDPVLRRSWELGRRAERVLRESGMLEVWESLGAKIRSVGSFRTDLMMKDRDIDLHVYTETLDPERVRKAVTPLLASGKVRKLAYADNSGTDEHCLEWHWLLSGGGSELWSFDVIQIAAGSAFDGFFEDTAEALIDVLTPADRRKILELKAAEPENSNICGMEFCRAVLEGNVTDWNAFLAWRRSVPPETLLHWRPKKG